MKRLAEVIATHQRVMGNILRQPTGEDAVRVQPQRQLRVAENALEVKDELLALVEVDIGVREKVGV